MPAAAAKVKGTAGPKARIVRSVRETPVSYTPDLVRVKAHSRGYYAVQEVMKDPRDNKHYVVRNPIIRNPGEVFEMDTADMRRMKDGELLPVIDKQTGKEIKQYPHALGEFGLTELRTEYGDSQGYSFELPSWVTLEDESDAEISVPEGHKTTFGKLNGEVL